MGGIFLKPNSKGISPVKHVGIIGGGPAGLSAALWLKNLGLTPWVIESSDCLGGMQRLNFLRNDWVLGQVRQTGVDLANRFLVHILESGVEIIHGSVVQLVLDNVRGVEISIRNRGSESIQLSCAALLIATGTRFRESEVLSSVPGFSSIGPECIAYGPFAFSAIESSRDRRVLIVGGGDNAFENARLLIGIASIVHVCPRSLPRVQESLLQSVVTAEASGGGVCSVHPPAKIIRFAVSDDGIDVTLAGDMGDENLTVDRIHVLAGYEPNTAFLGELLGRIPEDLLDEDGYLITDSVGRTRMAGIYAAGDVCTPEYPSVVNAIAQGAHAAKAIEYDLRAK